MKKRIISYLMMLILLTTCACAKKTSLKETNDEELIEILIPLSFMQFAGMNTKSTMAMFEEYGEEYWVRETHCQENDKCRANQ